MVAASLASHEAGNGVRIIGPARLLGDKQMGAQKGSATRRPLSAFGCGILPPVRRFHHVILILIGRAPYAYSTERMEFEMALDKFTAAVAQLHDAANRVIAKAQSDATAASQAQNDLAAVDETATAAIQPVIDALNSAVPPSA